MKDDNSTPSPAAIRDDSIKASIAVGLEVGCLTLFIVFVAVGGGLLIDKWLGTKLIFTILLVLGSAPLALFLTFKLAMREIRRVIPPAPAAKTQSRSEEDENE